MKVANKKCIRQLALRNMKQSKTRNIVAVIAIILTTVLFTSLFTIAISIIDGFQEANFHQIGTYAHGNFERLNEEQYNELKNDADIKEQGVRMLVGIAEDAPFHKASVEVSYCDETCAKLMYLTPKTGSLPTEGTNEAATDTKILKLLGIEPIIGTEFELTFSVNNEPVTKTFLLSGYWEADELAPTDHVLISKSMAYEICRDYKSDAREGKYAGLYDMYYMLDNTSHLESKAEEILARYGYQSENSKLDNYIGGGFNFSYARAKLNSDDMQVMVLIVVIVFTIMLTGYLVINNIFRIAIANDIRRYGLLKTIGTTKKQIRKMVYIESMILSGAAIPIGLVIGYGVGNMLAPVVIKELSGVVMVVSVNPFIFIFAAAFSLITVLISSLRPAKTASKVSPMKALRYTEGEKLSGSKTRKRRRVSMFQMAASNVMRNKAKAITTMLSLTLAVFLLNITFSITSGFDMDKYLKDVKADFMVAHANYFQANGHLFSEDRCITEGTIADINETGMVTESGAAYACGAADEIVYQYVPRDVYADDLYGMSDENAAYMLENENQIDGRYEDNVDLLGMDDFCIDQMNCVEGDISKLHEEGNYIAAAYKTDDFGTVEAASHWAKVGEHVTIRYVEKFEWYNPENGHVYTDDELENLAEDEPCRRRSVVYHDVDYEVCAIITIPKKMGYRYYLFQQYVISSDNLKANLPDANMMYYAYNVVDENVDEMEEFISDYTNNKMTDYDYESKQTRAASLNSLKRMFLILGVVLSFVIGLIGVLNFLNVNLTNIIVRKREFAMLQSIGMTGKQLKQMLATEGLIYALGSILCAVVILLFAKPILKDVIENMLWFCTYKTTLIPILCILPLFVLIGIVIPILVYRSVVKKSIVERLREGE